MKRCKFQLNDLLPIGLIFVVLGIALTYGLSVQGDTTDEMGTECCSDMASERPNNWTYTVWNSTSNNCYNSTGSEHPAPCAQVNSSISGIQGVATIPEKMPLIATVIIASIVIGILITYLMRSY